MTIPNLTQKLLVQATLNQLQIDQTKPSEALDLGISSLNRHLKEQAPIKWLTKSKKRLAHKPRITGKVYTSQLEGWVFDPWPLSECRSTPWARAFTQNCPGRGQISGFGLPLTAVTKKFKIRKQG